MLTILKRIFGKAEKSPAEPLNPAAIPLTPAAQMQFESAIQMAKVEVAKLSLAAIVQKFPQEMRDLVTKLPDDTMTVALPIQTIVKQLPAGVVRMSLASLHRQAPAGIFKALPAGDKRMVEVPLVEVFKHVKPTVLKRRADQKTMEVADEDLELPVFNDRHKPKESAPAPAPRKSAKAAPVVHEIGDEVSGTLPPPLPAMRTVAPPSDFKLGGPAPAKAPEAAPAKSDEPVLVLPLAKICPALPEAVRTVLASLDPATTVALPHSLVAPGLARGKIACSWNQLSEWLTPPASDSVEIDPATALVLPLKVIAPAFLAATKKPATPRKSVEVDETIPALFSGGPPKVSAEADAAPAPVPEPIVAEAPANPEVAPQPEAESTEAPALKMAVTDEPKAEEPIATEPSTEAPAGEAPVENTPPANAEEPTTAPPASAVGAAFGEPDKTRWTPAELIARVVKLPGVAGAVVALQEGFQVAHALPDGVNAETVSAFLPQIFSRLNQYAGEMKLGEVDDLLFTTRGAHCLIYRLGTVYFAVLGKPGASLPWNELRLVAAELSRQDQK